jgi:FkbM family methyltransferase
MVNNLNEWVLNLVKNRTAIVGGHFMHLDPHDSLDLSLNQVYEPLETELVRRLVKKGDTVLDIGANIGYYTLILARQVGPAGRVFAFEPDAENFLLLKRNVKWNGYKNVVLVNAAVSNEPGVLNLYLCGNNRGDHRIYPSGDARRTIEVSAVVADEYLGNLSNQIQFVKMDVQGAEGRVLLGLQKTLRHSPSCRLIFEFWPQGLVRSGDDPRKVLQLLSLQGFELQLLDEARKELMRVEPEVVLQEFTVEKGNQTNLLASRPPRKTEG